MAASPAVAAPVKPSLTLKRRLNASPEKVFAAWTKPETLAIWFGPGHCTSIEARIDLRVYDGGHMMYMRPQLRAALAADAAPLFAAASRSAEVRSSAPRDNGAAPSP